MKFNIVTANPPFSLDKWGAETAIADTHNRYHRGVPPKSKGDYAFILHMIESAVDKTGKVGVIVPHGVLFRGSSEKVIRQKLIEENLLEAVIGLPANLFFGTVRDNIRVGSPEASDADVDAAVDALGLREHFESFPEGLDTEVRERGSRLSAGEKQLVSLARAALADPTVLVLDEATSNLDPGTELEVERALEALTQGRTVIVVAHRLSTAQRCDRVAVVADGHILEIGTHDDLRLRRSLTKQHVESLEEAKIDFIIAKIDKIIIACCAGEYIQRILRYKRAFCII